MSPTSRTYMERKGNMPLLSQNARAALPPLYSQEDATDPMIFAKLSSPGSRWACYLVEGSPREDDFLVYGLFISGGRHWGQLLLSELETAFREKGLSLHEEDYPRPVRLSEVIPGMRRCRRKAS